MLQKILPPQTAKDFHRACTAHLKPIIPFELCDSQSLRIYQILAKKDRTRYHRQLEEFYQQQQSPACLQTDQPTDSYSAQLQESLIIQQKQLISHGFESKFKSLLDSTRFVVPTISGWTAGGDRQERDRFRQLEKSCNFFHVNKKNLSFDQKWRFIAAVYLFIPGDDETVKFQVDFFQRCNIEDCELLAQCCAHCAVLGNTDVLEHFLVQAVVHTTLAIKRQTEYEVAVAFKCGRRMSGVLCEEWQEACHNFENWVLKLFDQPFMKVLPMTLWQLIIGDFLDWIHPMTFLSHSMSAAYVAASAFPSTIPPVKTMSSPIKSPNKDKKHKHKDKDREKNKKKKSCKNVV